MLRHDTWLRLIITVEPIWLQHLFFSVLFKKKVKQTAKNHLCTADGAALNANANAHCV